jgi:hypothetical protein
MCFIGNEIVFETGGGKKSQNLFSHVTRCKLQLRSADSTSDDQRMSEAQC